MATIQIDLSMLEALLKLALGDEHLVWLDGQRDPDERTQRDCLPCTHKRPGRSSKASPNVMEAPQETLGLVFWDGESKLELDERATAMVREALAERLALLRLLFNEPKLARLQLLYHQIDWEQVLQSGVEVVETDSSQGNRIILPSLAGS